MKLKDCTCCKSKLTTKNTENLGRHRDVLYDFIFIGCMSCKTTLILMSKKTREYLDSRKAA